MSKLRRLKGKRAARSFRPPHCPNRKCPFYESKPGWKVIREGFFTRPSDRGRFQRYRCGHCRRRFSTRTFAADYWLRQRLLFPKIAQFSTEGPGLRQTARLLGISHSTVLRHLARAGRHCLLFHQEMVQDKPIREPLVMDGFESFEFSQFFPFHFNLAVGAQSWFLHHFTDSPLRRKGTMTPDQKARRAELEAILGRPDPKAVEKGIVELLRPLLPRWMSAKGQLPASWLDLHSDDHPAYPPALRHLRREPGAPRFRHLVTLSTERRTTSNPLFPVNLADLLLRHGQANHRRETIAFSKRRQGGLERLAIHAVWRNTIKRRREKGGEETAAMAAGILEGPLTWTEVFSRRRFPRRRLLPGPWKEYYWRKVKTLVFGAGQTEHRLRYAF
jgi:transposase-like protein